METQIFNEQDIPKDLLEKLGIELSEDNKQALLTGNRTELLQLKDLEEGDVKIKAINAKLSLDLNGELLIHPVYSRMELPDFLTIDDAEKLASGEIVNLEMEVNLHGTRREVLVEFDPETQEFLITDTDLIQVPDLINNEELTPEQKLKFKKGKEVELQEDTKVQYTATAPQGLRSNKLALIASLITDGGISYLLYKGLHAMAGEKHDLKSKEYSKGYHEALQDSQNNQIKDRMQGKYVQSR
ncbi:MAG: DUF3945 domain-containing protein [Sphingobacteriales bacterium]